MYQRSFHLGKSLAPVLQQAIIETKADITNWILQKKVD